MADINVRMPSENEDYDATTATAAPPTNPEVVTPSETPDFSKPAPVDTASSVEAPLAQSNYEADQAPVQQPAAPVNSSSEPKKSFPVWPVVASVLALAVIGLSLLSVTLLSQKKDVEAALLKANANPQLLVQKQTDDLITKVGSLMTLPSGETPTVANVSDADKAKQQSAFFANAENGDRVLMYVKAGQAILYRPSTNKIVLVAPLTFNNEAASGTASTTTKK